MLRSFIVFLMLIVVFFGGIIVGIDRGQTEVNHSDKQESALSSAEEQNNYQTTKDREQIVPVEEEGDENPADVEEPLHLTQKSASLLESGVNGFYEVVVQVLYQISELFF